MSRALAQFDNLHVVEISQHIFLHSTLLNNDKTTVIKIKEATLRHAEEDHTSCKCPS